MTLKEFIAGMPKAENHVHQDGCTTPQSALFLSGKNGVPIPFSTPEEADALFRYENLGDFIRVIDGTNAVIQNEDDIAFLVTEIGRDAKRQNIRLREVMLACDFHEREGIPLDEQLSGFVRGKEAAKELFDVELTCIPEVDRTMDPKKSALFPERLIPWREKAGIYAVGLESAEAGYPAHWHEEAFRSARELGFHVTSHAGEAYGPESIWDSIQSIGSERIDHGVRAIEDPELVRYLADQQIPLTICPFSNLSLKLFPDMASHSFGELYDAGIPISINSDDPTFFRGDLNENLEAVVRTFKLSKNRLFDLAANGFRLAFAPEEMKSRGIAELEAYFAANNIDS